MLHVRLLGGFSITWDQNNRPLIRSQAARSLFAYLVTQRQQPHTRDLLIGLFWPDLPETIARRRLSKALWQIRRVLEAEQSQALPTQPVINAEDDTLQLNPDLPLWLDVEAFVQCSRQVNTNERATLANGRQCLDLYQGEYLAGYHDDWALLERERLRELFLATLAHLVEGHKRCGEYEQALHYARRLAAADPWREEAHREAMRLSHLLGQDAAALNQFEICRQILADELDLEPSPETTALVEEIATRSDLLELPLLPSAARPTLAPFLERPDQAPLSGRQRELAELLHQVEEAAAGNGGLVIIAGEAGVGKSRLLRELAQNGRWRGLQTLWGRCYELVTPLPYLPLIEALQAGLSDLNDTDFKPLWRAELSRLLPEMAVNVALPPPLAPEEEKRRLLEAITRAFIALSEMAPQLVLLEDIHWMDPASLEVLSYLLPRLAQTRLLFVTTVRPEELATQPGKQRPAAMLAAMANTHLPRHLELKRLDIVGTEKLVQHLLGMARPAARFSERLYRETDGNPFFLIETLWAMIEDRSLRRDKAGEWHTPWDHATEDYAEMPLPVGIRQSIARRLDRLPGAIREMINLASVIGRGINFSLWCAAGGWSEQVGLSGCQELYAKGLLLPADSEMTVDVHADYHFAHDQIRRVTYQQLAPPRRRAYHHQIAQALLDLAPNALETLAYHWRRAEVWPQAAEYHQRAGDRARQVFANREAVAHYTEALAAVERLPDPVNPFLKFQLHMTLESLYDLLGQREPQLASLQELETLAKSLDDDRRRAEIALRRANSAEALGDYPEAITAVREAIRLAQTADNRYLQAVGHRQWGNILLSLGEQAAARDHFSQSLILARVTKSSQLEAGVLRNLGVLAYNQGDYGTARDHYKKTLAICLEIDDKRGEGKVRNNLALVAWSQGDYATAVTFLEQARRVYREVGDRRNEGSVLLSLGRVYLELPDYEGAQATLTQALAIFRQAGERQAEGWVLLNLGRAAFLQGKLETAESSCRQALHIFDDIHIPSGRTLVLINLGGVQRQQGEYDRARRNLEESLIISRRLGDRQGESWGRHYLADVLADLGDYVGALDQLTQTLAITREIGDRRGQGWALVDLSSLFHHMGKIDAALDHAQQAINIALALDHTLLHSTALLRLGRALSTAERLADASSAYEAALALIRPSGATKLNLPPLAGLCRLALSRGDASLALTFVEEILDYLKDNILFGIEEPYAIYLTCYQALKANSDSRAQAILATAYRLLEAQSAKISAAALRRSFLENVAVHREISQIYREQSLSAKSYPPQLPDMNSVEESERISIALPQTGAPRGRPLQEDEYVEVTWTLATAADETISGKAARRRRRLLRLLDEAQAQGATPTYDHLALALAVSRRTIERDIDSLRQQKLIPISNR